MFSFTGTQHIHTIGPIALGGQPGHHPTVLIGGLFFKGQPDFSAATQQLKTMYTLSKQTGNPAIPDFFIKKADYISDIVRFIKTSVPRTYPFSIDVIEPSIKVEILQELAKHRLLNRTIYNSIHVGITDEEADALTKYTPEMAILVAFNPKDKSPDGKIEVLENGANLRPSGLFDVAKTCGISQVLLDTAALAPGDNSGAAIAAIPVMKEEYGLPTGCAIHNVVEKSSWLDSFDQSRCFVDASSNSTIPLFGGDFAIFGPIEHASSVFPLIAWQDILISEYTESYFGIEPDAHHPRRILFK